jgi:hypothetical protein
VAGKGIAVGIAGPTWHKHIVGLSALVSNGGLSLLSSVLLGEKTADTLVDDTSSFDAVTSTKFDVVPGALEDDGIPTCSKSIPCGTCNTSGNTSAGRDGSLAAVEDGPTTCSKPSCRLSDEVCNVWQWIRDTCGLVWGLLTFPSLVCLAAAPTIERLPTLNDEHTLPIDWLDVLIAVPLFRSCPRKNHAIK